MRKTFCILSMLLILISCSQKRVPIGLRKTVNQLERELNDTIKYDFKISPERVARVKHHFGLGKDLRNEKGLWSGGLLKTYFKLNGINHADDMSSIILTTLHRKINNKPIKFREQKKYFKNYWKVAAIGIDSLNKYWNKINDFVYNDSIENVYFTNFEKGNLVMSSVYSWKENDIGASLKDVKMIAEIFERKERELKLIIKELGYSELDYQITKKVGDTIESDIYSVFLIPKTLAVIIPKYAQNLLGLTENLKKYICLKK